MKKSEKLLKKIALEKRKKYIQDSLPHLYGFDWYPYQKEFLKVNKEIQVLCCANQLGKTTILLAKLVKLATGVKDWPKIWADKPQTFIYMLPNQKLHDENARTKWVSVLPKHEFEDHPDYGWKWLKRGKAYTGIEFNSGVTILFLSYGQTVTNMQNISAHVIAFDEEPDSEIVPEVQTRTSAIKVAQANRKNAWGGFKIFAFTPTKSQNFFREVLEETGPKERWPVSQGNVWKKCVSLFECKKHSSGRVSIWTEKKINSIIKSLPTEAEVKRRVYGRFQASEDLVYPQFTRTHNILEYIPPLNGYQFYAGIDYGSGGTGHPSAIVFVAVNPDYTRAYVTDCWIGENILTTCSDVIDKYRSMIRGREIVNAYYDWGAKDLHTFAMRAGMNLMKANKDNKIGEDILNALFKNQMLTVCTTDYDSNLLCTQLTTFVKKRHKNKTFDDLIDALRYAVSSIPWDFQNSEGVTHEAEQQIKQFGSKRSKWKYRDGTQIWPDETEQEPHYSSELQQWSGLFDEF
jgi:phage terminase large subunit-like protein